MTDPFEVHKAAGGMRPLRVAGAAMGRGMRQAGTQAKQGQWSSAASTLKQSTKTSAKMTGIGAKRTGSGLNDKWNKAGFGTKLAVTGAGVGTVAGVGAYTGNKIGKAADPFEVHKSVTPGVRMVAAGTKPKRVQAAQDVMAMKGSGRKTLKAMDKLRPKK